MNTSKKIRMILSIVIAAIFALNLAVFAESVDGLIKKLEDKKVEVRVTAAQKLGQEKVSQAIQPLVNMLKTDKQYNARIAAAVALYKIGDKSVLPVLKKVSKNDENKTVRTVVTGIIKRMEEKS